MWVKDSVVARMAIVEERMAIAEEMMEKANRKVEKLPQMQSQLSAALQEKARRLAVARRDRRDTVWRGGAVGGTLGGVASTAGAGATAAAGTFPS